MIVVGIDAHKYTHTAAIVEHGTGRVVADVTVEAGDAGIGGCCMSRAARALSGCGRSRTAAT